MAYDRIGQTLDLLLLPPPPTATFEQFKDAYKPALSAVYTKLSAKLSGSHRVAVLDIALAIPDLLSFSCQSRARVFPYLQHFLATLYRLIGIICSEVKIKMDEPGGIDTRVVLVDYGGKTTVATEHHRMSQQGPVLDLQTLATSGRAWGGIYYLDNKAGQGLAEAFSSIASHSLNPVPAGKEWARSQSPQVAEFSQSPSLHYSVAVGGTWDHFHLGHKMLLTATALAVEPVGDSDPNQERLITVGVTVDELLVNKKFAEYLQNYDARCTSAASFLIDIINFIPDQHDTPRIQQGDKSVLFKLRPNLSLRMVQLSDPFGPTATEEDIDVLIVSKETSQGGAAVNPERARRGLKSLDVFEVDVLYSWDPSATNVERRLDEKISSTDIRRRRAHVAKEHKS